MRITRKAREIVGSRAVGQRTKQRKNRQDRGQRRARNLHPWIGPLQQQFSLFDLRQFDGTERRLHGQPETLGEKRQQEETGEKLGASEGKSEENDVYAVVGWRRVRAVDLDWGTATLQIMAEGMARLGILTARFTLRVEENRDPAQVVTLPLEISE